VDEKVGLDTRLIGIRIYEEMNHSKISSIVIANMVHASGIMEKVQGQAFLLRGMASDRFKWLNNYQAQVNWIIFMQRNQTHDRKVSKCVYHERRPLVENVFVSDGVEEFANLQKDLLNDLIPI
jgi:hypothetical protein